MVMSFWLLCPKLNDHLALMAPLVYFFSLECTYLIDRDPFHWSPPHVTRTPVGLLFLLMQRPFSYCSSAYLCTSLACRGCEVPWLKWLQISRQMEKRVWRIKLCDVTSGTGRVWIRLSENTSHRAVNWMQGSVPRRLKHRIPTTSFFFFFLIPLLGLFCFDLDELQLFPEKRTYSILTSVSAFV